MISAVPMDLCKSFRQPRVFGRSRLGGGHVLFFTGVERHHSQFAQRETQFAEHLSFRE